jgi:hypothetical protein
MARKRRRDSRAVDHQFEPFNIPKNLIRQLEATSLYPLRIDIGELHPDGKGVYALYEGGGTRPVYVGKTDKAGNVRKRLTEHAKKISGRRNISVTNIRFRYLVMESNWLARACEEFMIEHYKPRWQGSGFGSHVPGAGRPGLKGPDQFTKWYPLKAR